MSGFLRGGISVSAPDGINSIILHGSAPRVHARLHSPLHTQLGAVPVDTEKGPRGAAGNQDQQKGR